MSILLKFNQIFKGATLAFKPSNLALAKNVLEDV